MYNFSEYKTHNALEVEGGLSTDQNLYNFIMTILTGNMQCSASILYKQSQGEEQKWAG